MWAAWAALAALVLAAGCGGASARPAASTAASGYAVVVRSGGKTVGRFDVATLRGMAAVDVATPQSQGKQVQHGPRVRAVLARAGVQRFGRLRATGRDGARTFTDAEIDDQVVLDFDNQGTVKLAGAHLPQNRWVRDVTDLDAGP